MRTREMKANIKRGIKLLNKTVPNWRKRINLEKLDLGDTCKCIWGQANLIKKDDDYYDTLAQAGVNTNIDAEVEYGFFTWDDWEKLTQLWKEALS